MNNYDICIAGLVTCLIGIVFLFHIKNAKSKGLESKKQQAIVDPGNYRSIKVAIDLKVAIITLDRPRKKNAFSKLMYREVERAIRSASEDAKISVIMLIGVGDYYSSGNDLSNFSELKHPLTIAKEAREVLFSFVDSFITCQKPIIVAVNGPAIGYDDLHVTMMFLNCAPLLPVYKFRCTSPQNCCYFLGSLRQSLRS